MSDELTVAVALLQERYLRAYDETGDKIMAEKAIGMEMEDWWADGSQTIVEEWFTGSEYESFRRHFCAIFNKKRRERILELASNLED